MLIYICVFCNADTDSQNSCSFLAHYSTPSARFFTAAIRIRRVSVSGHILSIRDLYLLRLPQLIHLNHYFLPPCRHET